MRLIGIATKPVRGGPMELLNRALISEETGMQSDCCGVGGRSKRRQVTIITFRQWTRACHELYVDLPWQTRRANLYLDDANFDFTCMGKKIRIDDVVLEITGETAPCSHMDEAHPGLRRALLTEWRGGVTCRVVRGGIIILGDHVDWM